MSVKRSIFLFLNGWIKSSFHQNGLVSYGASWSKQTRALPGSQGNSGPGYHPDFLPGTMCPDCSPTPSTPHLILSDYLSHLLLWPFPLCHLSIRRVIHDFSFWRASEKSRLTVESTTKATCCDVPLGTDSPCLTVMRHHLKGIVFLLTSKSTP